MASKSNETLDHTPICWYCYQDKIKPLYIYANNTFIAFWRRILHNDSNSPPFLCNIRKWHFIKLFVYSSDTVPIRFFVSITSKSLIRTSKLKLFVLEYFNFYVKYEIDITTIRINYESSYLL